MARTSYAGGAPQTVLTSSMTAGAPTDGQTFTVESGTGYPTGADGDFVVTADRETPSMEKILCSERSGNIFTIATDGRGYDGTTAVSHGGGVTTGYVTHGVDATSLTDNQDHIYDPARDDHTQYPLKSILTAAGDLVYATGASVWARLAKGTARQVLAMNAGATAPEWVASAQSVLTTTGDLLYASAANTLARLGVGSNGHVLTLAGGVPTWAAASGGGAALLGQVSASPNQTGITTALTALTSMTTTVTVTSEVLIWGFMTFIKRTTAGYVQFEIRDSTAGASLTPYGLEECAADKYITVPIMAYHAPGAGSRTYILRAAAQANTVDFISGGLYVMEV